MAYLKKRSTLLAETALEYEEGVHVTTVTGSSGGTATINTDVDRFSYTKIGRTVRVGGTIYVTNVDAISGTLLFSLPFVMQGSVDGDGYWSVHLPTYNVNWPGDALTAQAAPDQSYVEIWGISDGGTTSSCATTGYYRFHFVYETTV